MTKDRRNVLELCIVAVLFVTGQGCGAPSMDGETAPTGDPSAETPNPGDDPVPDPGVDPDLPPVTELEPELVMLANDSFRVALWGTSDNDLFLAGGAGLLAHFDGTGWRPFEDVPGDSKSHFLWLFGTASDDVYAGALDGAVLHYDGDTWSVVDELGHLDVVDLWGSTSDNVYAITESTLMHFDGLSWEEVQADLPKELSWTGIAGHGEKHLVLVGNDNETTRPRLVHFDGAKWTAPALPEVGPLNDVWSRSSSETFAVGRGGSIVKFDGKSVTKMTSGTDKDLMKVHGSSGGEVFAVGHNAALRFDGDEWSDIAMPPNPTNTSQRILVSLFALDTDSVFIGDRGIHEFDGDAWETRMHYSSIVFDMSASSPDDVLFAGSQSYRYDGFTVEPEDFGALEPPRLRVTWATGDHIYAATSQEEFFLYDGEEWGRLAGDEFVSLHDMFGTSDQDVFAVGSSGLITHFDGTSWEEMESGTDSDLRGVWASSPSNVYAVGDDGTVLHYDGLEWSELFGSEDRNYLGLTGFGPERIMATSSDNLVYFSDGVSWRPEPASGILALHGTAPDNVFGVSERGLHHYDGNVWTEISETSLSNEAAVLAVGPREVYAAGHTGVFRFRSSQ